MYSPATVSSTQFRVKAKYIPSSDGGLRLASIQSFSVAKFRAAGWEDRIKATTERRTKDAVCLAAVPDDCDLYEYFHGKKQDLQRATRRAKIACMDYILCNSDLDMFATLTYEQSDKIDRLNYDDCYAVLRTWLNNRVTRKSLKYVAVCERQKQGGIHFHLLCNGAALSLVRAKSPYTGKYLTHGKKPLYNITDWTAGFTSAEYISGTNCRDKVAKYIFKYMSKDTFSKIGGRYFLHGGKLLTPRYAYGDTVAEFLDGSEVKYERAVSITGGLEWSEISFV